MNLFEDHALQDPVSPFVELLWERGTKYEHEVITGLELEYTDLSQVVREEKPNATLEAIRREDNLIYAGHIESDDLTGEPDLLRRQGQGYVPIDIKSGRGEEGAGDDDNKKPKKHYVVQLALYVDILERLGFTGGRIGYIWDIHGDEVPYEFDAEYGKRSPRTLWQDYQETLAAARVISSQEQNTAPAFASICKLCVWHSLCLERLEAANDLTLIPELGRSKRDVMVGSIPTVSDFAKINPDDYIEKKKTQFPRIGPPTLYKLHTRARLISTPDSKPYFDGNLNLPEAEHELFFDIEFDPFRDICYLHGFVVREGNDNSTEQYISYYADEATPDSEEEEFRAAWEFIQQSQPCVLYIYSKYERTKYRDLQKKYPAVCSGDDIEALFDPAQVIDLYYDVVQKGTFWPTRDHSLKTLASYLGFNWRDKEPSGAASIEWYDKWIETNDPDIRQRLLEYNEDDCRATRVLLDGIKALGPSPF
jgi:predicted RecB family nuclease